jgi:Ca2+/Na+ antiporter
MKLNKWLIVLGVSGVIAGLALYVLPFQWEGVDSRIMDFVRVLAGSIIVFISLVVLDRHITKRKRPDLLRKQRIEAGDERNTIIKDKAGAKTFTYLLAMILILNIVYLYFDVALDHVQLNMWVILASIVIYYVHIYYYKRQF